MQAASLINDFPSPTDQDIDAVMAGNLCRCMTYVRIRDAINRPLPNHGRLPAMTEPENRSALSRRMFLIGLVGTAATFAFAPEKATAQESTPFEHRLIADRRQVQARRIGEEVHQIIPGDELDSIVDNIRLNFSRPG
jgi:hypothetical protein